MNIAPVIVPLLFALIAVLAPKDKTRPWIVLVGAALHLALIAIALVSPPVRLVGDWLALDPLGRLILGFTSVLFFACAVYARGYLSIHSERGNRIFCACMLGFIAMLTLMVEAQHLGLMWVAIETTTLLTAPLVGFTGTQRSLEATWKYLLIGSVGIALALLGSLFLGYAAFRGGASASLLYADLLREAPILSRPWLRSAFIILFVGYGTKMGLAPMHTWKPDAYGEAPGVVGTLLAGGLTSCAFLAIVRFFQICNAAGDAAFARQMMTGVGLFSMAVAAVFMARQKDFKRMLAYSSVEHMGILVLGIGIGKGAIFGSMLHMMNNALTKGVLFLSAANIQRAYGSKTTDDVRGALQRVPVSAALLLAGFFAITASPPFGPFFSELSILDAAIAQGHHVVAGLFLLVLVVIFIGMGSTVLAVVQGSAPAPLADARYRDRLSTVLPGLVLISIVLFLGLYIPRPIDGMLRSAANFIEAGK
jgi:hydrogenase-4 component F